MEEHCHADNVHNEYIYKIDNLKQLFSQKQVNLIFRQF